MPVFNAADVKLSVDGVLSQTYKNLELIIIDDHSNNQTAQLLEKFSSSQIIALFSLEIKPI